MTIKENRSNPFVQVMREVGVSTELKYPVCTFEIMQDGTINVAVSQSYMPGVYLTKEEWAGIKAFIERSFAAMENTDGTR